jgi:P4 family phage/plasmid primase-like protien
MVEKNSFGKEYPDYTFPVENFRDEDMVAILCGPTPRWADSDSWLAVIDLDGDWTVNALNEYVGEDLPPTLSSKGYRHLYYKVPPSEARSALRQWAPLFGRKVEGAPKVDLKWSGGYAIEPAGKWDVPFDPDKIAVLPTTWIRRVLEIRNARPTSGEAGRDDGTRVDMGDLPQDVVGALAQVWPQRGEGCHDAALALGGILGESHWSEDDIARFAGALFLATGTSDRTKDVLDSVATRRSGGEAMGWPTLKAILNETEAGKAAGKKGVDAALRLMKEQVPGLRAQKVQLPNLDERGRAIPTGAKASLVLNIGSAAEVADDIIKKELDGAVFAEGKFWRCADGLIWTEIPRHELVQSVMAYDGVVYDLTDKGREIKLKVSAGFTSSTIDLMSARLNQADFFVKAKVGALFTDGTFVGLSGPEPCTPDHRCRARLGVAYGKAPVPRTLAAMRDWFEGCPDAAQRVACLFEHLGLSVVGGWAATNHPGGTILLGTGANGKSVWLEVVRALMQPGTVSSVPPQEFAREYSRAGLAGSRLNICTEIPERQILASGHMKAIFSYETITGRLPYGQPFDFIPQCGHIFSCNALPATEDQSAGFWRRWKVIRFPHQFEGSKANPKLASEILEHEAQGLTFYAVEAALAAVRRGSLTMPDSSAGELDDWRMNTDQVAEFLAECVVLAPELSKKDWIGLNTLYQSFKAWCQTAGHEGRMTRKRFKERMKGMKLGGLSVLWAKTERADVAFAVRMNGGPITPPTLAVVKGGRA